MTHGGHFKRHIKVYFRRHIEDTSGHTHRRHLRRHIEDTSRVTEEAGAGNFKRNIRLGDTSRDTHAAFHETHEGNFSGHMKEHLSNHTGDTIVDSSGDTKWIFQETCGGHINKYSGHPWDASIYKPPQGAPII